MKKHVLYGLSAVALLVAACDSTPRERQDIVKQEARKLDTVVDAAAAKLRVAGRRAARFDSVSRARSRQPLDKAGEAAFTNELLGTYSTIENLTPTTIEPAFVQFMQQVRARRKQWTQRDWDYATALSRRLNAQFRAIRLDIKGRDELHIRALQTEFTALETGRDVKDLGDAVKQP
jgi:predicted small secreted protein